MGVNFELSNQEKEQSAVLPEASSFGRRAEDVELMAARWKANIEACLTIYPTILKMPPEIFSAEKVDLKGADDLLSAGDGLAGSSPGKVMVPTAAAGNASLGTTKTTTTAAYIDDPEDDDGRLDEELREEEAHREEASRRSDDQYSSAVRTQVLHKDLASKGVVHFLMDFSM